jgi:hypothetical protein
VLLGQDSAFDVKFSCKRIPICTTPRGSLLIWWASSIDWLKPRRPDATEQLIRTWVRWPVAATLSRRHDKCAGLGTYWTTDMETRDRFLEGRSDPRLSS